MCCYIIGPSCLQSPVFLKLAAPAHDRRTAHFCGLFCATGGVAFRNNILRLLLPRVRANSEEGGKTLYQSVVSILRHTGRGRHPFRKHAQFLLPFSVDTREEGTKPCTRASIDKEPLIGPNMTQVLTCSDIPTAPMQALVSSSCRPHVPPHPPHATSKPPQPPTPLSPHNTLRLNTKPTHSKVRYLFLRHTRNLPKL